MIPAGGTDFTGEVHRLAGTPFWVVQRRGTGLELWVPQGDGLLRAIPLGGASSAPSAPKETGGRR